MVYNDLRRDARVRRVSNALAQVHDVTVIGIAARDAGSLAAADFRAIEIPIDHLGSFPRAKYVLYWLRAFFTGLRLRFDAVHCHDIYPMPAAAMLARVRRVPLIYDAHELVDHVRSSQTLLGRFWDAAHRWAVRRADLVIAANESRARFLVEHGYRPRRPPVVVMNIGDGAAGAQESAIETAMSEAGVTGAGYLVIYQGWLAHDRHSVELVEAFGALPEDMHLLLVGNGPAMADVRRRVQELGLERRVHLTGYLPKERVLELVAGSDLGILLYDSRVLNNYYCAPNKLFDYIAAAIPVVASDLPEPRRVLAGTGAGVLVAEASPEALAAAIRSARTLEPDAEAFRCILDRFSWSHEVERLLTAYRTIVFGDVSDG